MNNQQSTSPDVYVAFVLFVICLFLSFLFQKSDPLIGAAF